MSTPESGEPQRATAHTGAAAGFDYAAYLEAKQGVDDQALNHVVYAAFVDALQQHAEPKILELGAGLGTMLLRLLRRGALRRGTYTLLDADPGSARRAQAWLAAQFPGLGLQLHVDPTPSAKGMHAQVTGTGVELALEWVEAEAGGWLRRAPMQTHVQRFDFALAHTFMDLVHPVEFLPRLWAAMCDGAGYWFTSTFDGHTAVTPPHPDDAEIWGAYHDSMRARGGPRHGQVLAEALRLAGAQPLVRGRGDWRVPPGPGLASSRTFVGFILQTVQREPAVAAAVGQSRLDAWLRARRRQLEAGALGFEAHQVDLFGRAPSL